MAVPEFQALMLPVLDFASHGNEIRMRDLVEEMASRLKLTNEEKAELLPSGTKTRFANRVHWAKAYLYRTGLLENTRRGHFRITDRGRGVLAENPPRIDLKFLRRFPELAGFHRGTDGEASAGELRSAAQTSAQTPDEVIRIAHRQIDEALQDDLLKRILGASPAFFERLIIALLERMGYGGALAIPGRHLGGSGDDGVDGVVDQDALGLERVYVQAKRYSPERAIGPEMIRAFAGSLQMLRATKGVFVTTSTFSEACRTDAERVDRRIVLIDGEKLTELMIRFDVGVRIEDTFHVKKADEDFFAEE